MNLFLISLFSFASVKSVVMETNCFKCAEISKLWKGAYWMCTGDTDETRYRLSRDKLAICCGEYDKDDPRCIANE